MGQIDTLPINIDRCKINTKEAFVSWLPKLFPRLTFFPGIKGVNFILKNVKKICLVDNLNSWKLFLKNKYNYQNTLISYFGKRDVSSVFSIISYYYCSYQNLQFIKKNLN